MAKTFLALLIAGLLLGGCVSAEELTQQQATACQGRSLKPGTVEYAQCLSQAPDRGGLPWWAYPPLVLLALPLAIFIAL